MALRSASSPERYNFACVLAGHLGDKDGAIKMLQSTLPLSGAMQVKVADTDTDLDILRDDPRFQRLIAEAKKRHGIQRDEAPAPLASTRSA